MGITNVINFNGIAIKGFESVSTMFVPIGYINPDIFPRGNAHDSLRKKSHPR
jgi:hypothetical protein